MTLPGRSGAPAPTAYALRACLRVHSLTTKCGSWLISDMNPPLPALVGLTVQDSPLPAATTAPATTTHYTLRIPPFASLPLATGALRGTSNYARGCFSAAAGLQPRFQDISLRHVARGGITPPPHHHHHYLPLPPPHPTCLYDSLLRCLTAGAYYITAGTTPATAPAHAAWLNALLPHRTSSVVPRSLQLGFLLHSPHLIWDDYRFTCCPHCPLRALQVH